MYPISINAISGNELFVLMNSNQHDSVRYIQGLVDMQRFIYLSEKNIPNKKNINFNEKLCFCVFNDITYGQMHDVYKKYLTNNPEIR